MVVEPNKRGSKSSISEQPKPRPDKSTKHVNTHKTSRQHNRDGNGSEHINGDTHQHGHQKDKRNKDSDVSGRRGSFHEKRTKQQQSSVSGNESGETRGNFVLDQSAHLFTFWPLSQSECVNREFCKHT